MKKLFYNLTFLALIISGSISVVYGQTKSGITYLERAATFQSQNQLDSAFNYYQLAIAYFEQAAHWDSLFQTQVDVGLLLEKERRYEEGIQTFSDAIEISKSKLKELSGTLGLAYHARGRIYNRLKNFKLAGDDWHEALAIREKLFGPDHQEVESTLNNLTNVYDHYYGDSRKALEFALRVTNLREKRLGFFHPRVARHFSQLGALYYTLLLYDSAAVYYEKALKSSEILFKENKIEPFRIVIIYNNYGFMFLETGKYNKAAQLFEASRNYFNPEKDHESYSLYLFNQGLLLLKKGKYGLALSYFKKALVLRKEIYGERNMAVAQIWSHMAIAYSHLHDYQNCKKCVGQHLSIAKEFRGDNHSEVVAARQNLGVVHMYEKKYWEAIAIFEEIIRDMDANLNIELSVVYQNLGNCYYNLKDIEQAILFLEKAYQIRRQLKKEKQDDFLNSSFKLADMYCEGGYHEKSFQLIDEGLAELYPDIESSEAPIRLDESKLKDDAYTYLFFLLRARNNLFLSRKYPGQKKHHLLKAWQDQLQLQRLWKIFQKNNLTPETQHLDVVTNKTVFEQGIELAVALWKVTGEEVYQSYIFEFMERSKASLLLKSLLKSDAERLAGIPPELLQREKEMIWEIRSLEKILETSAPPVNLSSDMTGSQVSSQSKEIKRLNNELTNLKLGYYQFLQTLQKDYPRYYNLKHDPAILSLASLRQDFLTEQQSLIEYFVGEEDQLYLLHATRENVQVEKVPLDYSLEEKIKEFRHILTVGRSLSSTRYVELATELYRDLVAPVSNQLKKELIIIPDDVLGLFPFEALLVSQPPKATRFQSHEYLIKTHTIHYNYSASLLPELKTAGITVSIPHPFLGFAPFVGTEGKTSTRSVEMEKLPTSFEPLPHSEAEVLAIQQLLGGAVYIGEEAIEALYYQLGNQCEILHFSTHGSANDSLGKYSYLAFYPIDDEVENEFLFVSDIYGNKISAKLVVLSACEAGIGELLQGEGMISLSRAFFYAGAKSVVTSLWKVDDEKSKNLIVQFYKNLHQGMPKHKALRQAKLWLIEKGTHADAHPYFWAGFVPLGVMSALY